MIACVAKTAQNADFYQIIDFLSGCSINYSLLVDPDLIGPWLQQFWATASLRVINDVPHIRAMVAGKKILISEETIRADLLFDDANGVDCFPKQVIWDVLRDIGYEGNLAQLTFSKPLFSPQWKYLVHVLLHCLSPKSTSWEQFGTNIASALVGLATNQKFNFSLMIMNGMLGHISNALAAEEEHSTSPHSKAASSARDAQGTPSQSAAQASISQGTADVHGTDNSQGTASLQGTAASLGTARLQGTAAIPTSPNDYTPTDASQTSGGDEGLLDIYALNREVRRLKKQTLSQAKQILKLKAKLKKLSKFVQPVVKHHAFWVESQNLKKQKRRRKKQRKKVSSVKMGRNKEEGTLSEEHYDQEEDTADPFFDDIVDKDAAIAPDIDRKSNETEVLERKSDETEEINIEEKEASNVKSGDTEELDLEITQSTARQSTITPRTLNFEDEAGPSSPLRPIQVMESEEQLKVAEVLVAMSRPRGLSIPGSIQTQPQQSSQEVEIRKIQAEWDAEEEGKRFEELKKAKTTLRKPTSLAQERNQMMNFLKEKEREMLNEREAKRLLRKRKATISEEQPSKKPKLRTETIDELRNYLRVVDFEKNAQDRESLEGISMITELQVIDSPDGEICITYIECSRLNMSTLPNLLSLMLLGVHTLELEDGTMIHMLAERRYPLSRELMIRMLDHGMEVEDENETAITLIHLFILWTTEDGGNS
ncbi:hypothetical protein Tco_0812054 [Tanacetum coccineum]